MSSVTLFFIRFYWSVLRSRCCCLPVTTMWSLQHL